MIFSRIPESRFSIISRAWDGATVVILGGGPSLTLAQIALVHAARRDDGIRVLAINDAYLLAPWADVCYAADSKWHVWHTAGVAKPKLNFTAAMVRESWAAFAGEKCGIETAQPYLADDVHMLRVARPGPDHALSIDPAAIATGRLDGYTGHGGFQALNIATLAGAKTILLLGFDGRPGADGRTNFHGEHPTPTPAEIWQYIPRSFSPAERELKAAGVHVLNCSPSSAIDTFPKVALADALMVAA